MTKTERIENHKKEKSNRHIPTTRFRCTNENSFSTNIMESLQNRIPFQFITVSKKKMNEKPNQQSSQGSNISIGLIVLLSKTWQ